MYHKCYKSAILFMNLLKLEYILLVSYVLSDELKDFLILFIKLRVQRQNSQYSDVKTKYLAI